MSEKYKFQDPEALYFTTSAIVYWIDLFTRRELRYIIIHPLKNCQKRKGLLIHAWVLMPSHLHMIISSGDKLLSEILRDFKKFTSRKIVQEIENINESRREWLLGAFTKAGRELKRISEYKVWKDGNHPILLDNSVFQQEKLDDIHHNPVEAEFVDEPEYTGKAQPEIILERKG